MRQSAGDASKTKGVKVTETLLLTQNNDKDVNDAH